MRMAELTIEELKWLAHLARKSKMEATNNNKNTPHPLLEFERDKWECLEGRLSKLLECRIERERRKTKANERKA